MDNSTVLVPVMLFGWVPLTIISFWFLKPHKAVLFSVIGGYLFLPVTGYDLPGLPAYDRTIAVSTGLVLGVIFSSHRRTAPFHLRSYDIPILLWCLCPIATSLSNQLGLYDGMSGVLRNCLVFAVPYFAGRFYFYNQESLRDLCLSIVLGGIIYFPLCLWEVRMSPQLHKMIYGFFQHDFIQHMRYGGFRPILFMQHGLMVSLWMALSTVVCFWYWRNSEEKHYKGIPMFLIFAALAITTILCKSANGWAILVLGTLCYGLYRNFNTIPFFKTLVLTIPLYFFLRMSGLISSEGFIQAFGLIFDQERIYSLSERLSQEDLISTVILKRPVFGWGMFDRGMPIDPVTGKILVRVRDSFWIITAQTYGFFGLFSLYATLLLGPWLIFSRSKIIDGHDFSYPLTLAVTLSLAVVFFSIDTLFNAMVGPIFFLIPGALISFSQELFKNEQIVDLPRP